MKVLATTDGSEFSALALERLGTLIPVKDTEVVLLAVFPDPAFGPMGYMGPPYLDYAQIAHQVEAEAQGFVTKGTEVLARQGFQVRPVVRPGDPASVILELIASERLDLVVMGSHGRTGLTRFLLGSVSSRVASHAPCSVLIVKGPNSAKG